ncbi:MAG: hypothetical protein LQ350_001273 [Teloschistes chrysophthalmus]|nr:MAG: hypothetical protein LQ350_001273 [Niorma chrysophthalma]
MPGAGKKRAKENRPAEQKPQHGQPAGNDGPSDRPGSSSGPPANPESSRGRAPSNAPSNPPSNTPGQSARGGSRPPSASGAPLRDPARDQPLPPRQELNRRIEWAMDEPMDPFKVDNLIPGVEVLRLRPDIAMHPDGTPVVGSRQLVLDVNEYREQMPKKLMQRPGFGGAGKKIQLKLNSHRIESLPTDRIYQYDVQIGNGKEKRGLIKAIWGSDQLNNKLPGGRIDWLYDGSKLAWSTKQLKEDLKFMVDLDAEPTRNAPKPASNIPVHVPAVSKRPRKDSENAFLVVIRKTTHVDLAMIDAFLNGKTDFGPGVIDSINFLDHLIRENPAKNHINIKKSYFDRDNGATVDLGDGVEAMRGVYQSIRMAEGKRLVLNVDVSHTTFWRRSSFPSLVNQLSKFMDLEQLQNNWRKDNKDPKTTNYVFNTMKRLKKNSFIVEHKGRSEIEKVKVWKVHDILNMSSREFKFRPFNKTTGKEDPEISLPEYYYKKYNIWLQWPALPPVQTTNKSVVFPMEVCNMIPGQRYPYKLNEGQTRAMIKFAATKPDVRQNGILAGTKMLNWANDPYLKHYKLKIEEKPIMTNARILDAPVIQMNKDTIKPGTRGSWDLRGKKFLEKNPAPLIYWGVAIISMPGMYQRQIQRPQVLAFIARFIEVYQSHGGEVHNKQPLVCGPYPDPAKGVEDVFTAVGNKHQVRPQFILFFLPNTSTESKPNGTYFTKPTMIIGADVSHAAPGIGAPSYAAMTVSMDRYAARYAAGVQTNGYRVEMISTRNLRDMLVPLFRQWMQTIAGGNPPDHVYYFRDGVSEGQYLNVLKYEVADMKEIWRELYKLARPNHEVMYTVVVAEKRHHIRFFPGAQGDRNQNPLPGTIVDRDVTHPFENDVYLCSHKAIQGTARPTHYHMLMDEAKVKTDDFQRMLYDHCYQYMRSTTPVSLFPAVYYAHLASNRARAHEDISETERKLRDSGPTKSTHERPVEEPKPLLDMINRIGMRWGMWYI